MKLVMDIKGMQAQFKSLDRAMETMSRRVKRGSVRGAMEKATTPTLQAMRAGAPSSGGQRSGALKKSLGKKTKTNTKTDAVFVVVGPRSDQKFSIDFKPPGENKFRTRKPSRYAHLVEKGRKGFRGYPGNPFVEPAYNSTKGEFLSIYKRVMASEIERAAAKVRSQMAKGQYGRGGRR